MANLCQCIFPDGGYAGLKYAEIKQKYQLHPLMYTYIVLCCNYCISGFFIDINTSDRTMALGLTQPLTEMSTRRISWGLRWPVRKPDNLPPSCAVVTKSGNFNFLEPSGPVQVCNGTDLPFPLTIV